MRKSFKHILLAGLTIASTAMAMNAQTLTQDWKVTEGLPTAGNARWGIGFDGKVYTNDKSVPQIIAINAEGKTSVATSAAGTAITVDGAGNFIVNDGFPNAASSTTFKILPAGTTEMIDLTVTLPEGVTAGRMDLLGRAVGNVMSETGGGFYGGGGIRFNADFSLLAIGTSDKTLTVFEVSKDDNGAPVLTEKYKFATTIGRNLNDIAWDCANNLYIVSNSGELFKSVALPRESGEVVVAAPSSYDINISSDEYPASVYVIGQETGWDPENGVKLTKGENGVYTGTVTGPCNFGITTVLSADWDVVNANRYGFEVDNTAVTLNQAMPLVKAAGAIRVAEEGEFELTVDLKNMTVLVAGEAPVVYPEKLYLLGSVEPNAWDPADETHVANPISEGIYQIDNVSILAADENDYGYFAFTSTPGTWDDVNAHRYGPAVKDTELADKTMSAIGLNGDTSYKIKSGAYSITVDLGLNTIYAVRLGDNVNDAAVEAAKVVAGIGEIRIIGEANAVSIFNAAGQAVAVNSKDAQFFVASGIYVVVVDGKTTKVLVK